MQYKALKSFGGMASGFPGQVLELSDETLIADLTRAGLIEAVAKKEPEETAGGDGKTDSPETPEKKSAGKASKGSGKNGGGAAGDGHEGK